MAKIFKVAEDEKCGCCNYQVSNLYLIAETEEEAKSLYREYGNKGLCADCLIEYVIMPQNMEIEEQDMYPREMYAKILISTLTPLDGQHQEELEDEIKHLLNKIGVKAKIKSLSTGNEMTT